MPSQSSCCFQYPGRPAGRVLHVRFHHGQGHLAGQVPGAVHDVRSLGGLVVQVQGQVMLNRGDPGKVIGIRIAADGAGDIRRRSRIQEDSPQFIIHNSQFIIHSRIQN